MAAPKDFDFEEEDKDKQSLTSTEVKDKQSLTSTEVKDKQSLTSTEVKDKTTQVADVVDSDVDETGKETEIEKEQEQVQVQDETEKETETPEDIEEKPEDAEEPDSLPKSDNDGSEESKDMNPDTQNYETQSSPPYGISDSKTSSGGPKPFIIGGVLALILLIGGGGFLFYKNQSKSEDEVSQTLGVTEESPQTEEQAQVAQVVEIDRAEWTLEVLNGSGVSGAAAKAKTALEEKGYKVSKTGNADSSDYTASEIMISSDMADKGDALLADLKDEFNLTKSGDLDSDTVSARIIIGKDWADTSASTPEATGEEQ